MSSELLKRREEERGYAAKGAKGDRSEKNWTHKTGRLKAPLDPKS